MRAVREPGLARETLRRLLTAGVARVPGGVRHLTPSAVIGDIETAGE